MHHYFNPSLDRHFPDMMAGWPAYHNDNNPRKDTAMDEARESNLINTMKDGLIDLVRHQMMIGAHAAYEPKDMLYCATQALFITGFGCMNDMDDDTAIRLMEDIARHMEAETKRRKEKYDAARQD